MLRRFRTVILTAAVAVCALHARSAAAQASAYVPLDDNAYVYADALIARGRLGRLSQLERPYRVTDLRRAMADDTSGSPAMKALYRRLGERITVYDVTDIEPGKDVLRFAVTPYLIATEQTSGIRDLMRPNRNTKFRPGFGGIGIVQGGPIVAGLRAYDDPRLKDDPEFLGKKDRAFAGRMEDAYLSVQLKYGELSFGRLARNWGPPQLDGLLLGHYAYTYDHLYLKVGVPAFHLSSVVTRLDDSTQVVGGALDTAHRYLAVHQLAAKFGNLEAAVSEAVVYGGRTENFRPNFVNPVTPYILSQVLEKAPANILFAADVAYRSRYGNFSLQGMLDDVAIDDCPGCDKPNSFAATVTAEGVPLYRDQRLFASYTMVTNLTYRNEEWYDGYMSQNVGIGRGYSDYDEARLGLDLLIVPGIPLRPYLAYRRQGEGDYRIPHPDPSQYASTAQFLSGVVQHTTRIGLTGAGAIARFVQITGDVGMNHATNYNHVPGATDSRFVGRVKVTIESPWRLRRAFAPE